MAYKLSNENLVQGEKAARDFEAFMRRLIAVPHSEIKAAMEAEKTRKKSSSVSRVPAASTKP